MWSKWPIFRGVARVAASTLYIKNITVLMTDFRAVKKPSKEGEEFFCFAPAQPYQGISGLVT
jgi:hypothetical protein